MKQSPSTIQEPEEYRQFRKILLHFADQARALHAEASKALAGCPTADPIQVAGFSLGVDAVGFQVGGLTDGLESLDEIAREWHRFATMTHAEVVAEEVDCIMDHLTILARRDQQSSPGQLA